MYERFTNRAKKVINLAIQEGKLFNHEHLGTEHLLLGLSKEGEGVAANVLEHCFNLSFRRIHLDVKKKVPSAPELVTMSELPQTAHAKKAIENAWEEAQLLSHNYVGTEHLLLGLLRVEEGLAIKILEDRGLRIKDIRDEVLNILGHGL